jgi:general secretion pathway protein M
MSEAVKGANPCYRAVGVLLALLLGLNLAITWPWLNLNGKYNETLAEINNQIRRFQNLQAQGPQLEAQLKSLDREVGNASFYVDAHTPALAAAALQKQVKSAVDGAGGKLTSTQNLPLKEEGNAQRVAILVRMSGDVDALFKVLYDLEAASPLLFIDNLTVRNRPTPRRRRSRRPQPVSNQYSLDISFELTGYLRESGA